MSKKFTFYVISDSHAGTKFRQITLPGSVLRFAGVLLLICCCTATFYFCDIRRHLNEKSDYCNSLELQTVHREKELAYQHRQIQSFADQLNQVKTRLFALEDLEQKVRTIAKLDNPSVENREKFNGIGGSMPEDLDAEIPLEQKHNSLIREMHEQFSQLDIYVTRYHDNLEVLLGELEERQNLLASTPSIKPAEGVITSKFGYRKSPFSTRREFHKGLDIANRRGTPIRAAANGMVTFVGRKGSFGNMVIINHGHGMVTRYAHMNTIKIRRGISVSKGDIIGTIGNTGLSTGPHLHYEVRLNGLPVDPSKYILN